MMKKSSTTNWRRVEAMGDATIDTSDIPPLSEAFFKKANARNVLSSEDQEDFAAAIFAEAEVAANGELPISWKKARKQLRS